MKPIPSKILLGMLLFARTDAMIITSPSDNKTEAPLITLASIYNKMTYPEPGGRVECLVNGKEVGSVHSEKTKALNVVLCARHDKLPLIRRLNLEPRHPLQKGFREFRLKLDINPSYLIIVKDFGERVQRPPKSYAIEAGKKYLLNLIVQRENGCDWDEVVTELIEDTSEDNKRSLSDK